MNVRYLSLLVCLLTLNFSFIEKEDEIIGIWIPLKVKKANKNQISYRKVDSFSNIHGILQFKKNSQLKK